MYNMCIYFTEEEYQKVLRYLSDHHIKNKSAFMKALIMQEIENKNYEIIYYTELMRIKAKIQEFIREHKDNEYIITHEYGDKLKEYYLNNTNGFLDNMEIELNTEYKDLKPIEIVKDTDTNKVYIILNGLKSNKNKEVD